MEEVVDSVSIHPQSFQQSPRNCYATINIIGSFAALEEERKIFPKSAHMMQYMRGRRRFFAATAVAIAISLVLAAFYTFLPLLYEPEGSLPLVEYMAIATDSEDNLHIVWDDGRDEGLHSLDGTFLRTRVYYSKIDSNGKEIVPDKPISSGGGIAPLIEIDSADNVFVAYVMNGTFLVKLNTDGEKILEKKVLEQMPLTMSLTIGSDDDVYLSWLECSQGLCFQYYIILNSDAESVLGMTNVSQTSSIPGFPVVLDQNSQYVYLGEDGSVDTNGNIHVIKHQNDYLHFTKIDQNGVVIINNTQIPGTAEWSVPLMLSLDSDDDIHITGITSSGIGYMKLNQTGNVTTSNSGIRVGDIRDVHLNPNIDVDSSDNAYVVWHIEEIIREDQGGNRDFAYSSYCAKINATGAVVDTWTIAKSESQGPNSGDFQLGLALVVVLTTMLVILLVVLKVKGKKMEPRESPPTISKGDKS